MFVGLKGKPIGKPPFWGSPRPKKKKRKHSLTPKHPSTPILFWLSYASDQHVEDAQEHTAHHVASAPEALRARAARRAPRASRGPRRRCSLAAARTSPEPKTQRDLQELPRRVEDTGFVFLVTVFLGRTSQFTSGLEFDSTSHPTTKKRITSGFDFDFTRPPPPKKKRKRKERQKDKPPAAPGTRLLVWASGQRLDRSDGGNGEGAEADAASAHLKALSRILWGLLTACVGLVSSMT